MKIAASISKIPASRVSALRWQEIRNSAKGKPVEIQYFAGSLCVKD